ncbi:MAG: general secretion pathway protein GspB [Verrucomicrobiae bacterium]|nr:general secretion pathway protein GspB [Verrucomicrobiae bacterium]
MSLISEALKRAQQNPPTSRPLPQPKPRHAPPTARTTTPANASRVLPWVAPAAIVLAGAVALAGLWRLYSVLGTAAKQTANIRTTEPTARQPSQPPASPLFNPVVPGNIDTVLLAVPPVETPKPVPPPPAAQPESQPVQSPPTPQPREFPKLTLQGITIYGKEREALINGQTVTVGDVIEEATVLAIEPRSVKLRFDGREFTLRLP